LILTCWSVAVCRRSTVAGQRKLIDIALRAAGEDTDDRAIETLIVARQSLPDSSSNSA
jgi:hypothetical protein